MQVNQALRLEELENAKLKLLGSELSMEKPAFKETAFEKLLSPERGGVRLIMRRSGMSERRALRVGEPTTRHAAENRTPWNSLAITASRHLAEAKQVDS